MGRIWCIGVAAAWLICAAGAGAAEFPKGTFTASPQKDWSIKFEDKGRFAVVRGGMAVVEGTYQATESELTLTDESGKFASKDKEMKTGRYKWKLDGGKLKFTLVDDKSKGRELLLTSNTWEPKK